MRRTIVSRNRSTRINQTWSKKDKDEGLAVVFLTSIHSHKTRWIAQGLQPAPNEQLERRNHQTGSRERSISRAGDQTASH